MKKIKSALAAVLAVCSLMSLSGCSESREQGSSLIDGDDNSDSDLSSFDSGNSDKGNVDSSKDSTSGFNTSEPDVSNFGNSAEHTSTELSGNNTLNSIRLFDMITADNKNAMFSPLSLNMALGLIEAGAKGETKAQIDSYLQTDNYADFAKAYIKYAREKLTKEERKGDWYTYPRNTVEIANSFWVNNFLPVNESYKQAVIEKFDAEIQNVDFGNTIETLGKINGWVNEKTHEMIPTILNECDDETAAVLINTVYFESPWYLSEWRIDENSKESFTLIDGTAKEIPLMYRYGNSYFENDNATAFSCDYSNGTKFIGILPKKSGEFTLEELDIPSLLMSETSSCNVSAVMPRLNFETEFLLSDALGAAGMENMFDGVRADFSGISPVPLCISQVIQKTKLELDENGTKAAAATVMVLTGGGGEDEERISKTVRLDRAFAFMIYDPDEQQILFIGKVTEP